MLRKVKTSLLLGIFLALGAIYIIMKIAEPNNVGNMPTFITAFNPAECTEISISAKKDMGNSLTLSKKSDGWTVAGADKNAYRADSNVIKSLLNSFSKLKPLRIATQSKERWQDFSVTDSAGTQITFNNKDGKLASLIIGRFTYTQSPMAAQMRQRNPYMRQNPGTMSTYVRSGDKTEVYAVEGFLASEVKSDVNTFRDKSFLALGNESSPVKFTFTYPADSSFVLQKKEGKWFADDIPADSASVADYLRGLRNLKLRAFSEKVPQQKTHKLVIQTSNGNQIYVDAELSEDTAIIVSDQNPENMALDKNKYLFEKLYPSKKKLISK
jgi:hypothetical protein